MVKYPCVWPLVACRCPLPGQLLARNNIRAAQQLCRSFVLVMCKPSKKSILCLTRTGYMCWTCCYTTWPHWEKASMTSVRWWTTITVTIPQDQHKHIFAWGDIALSPFDVSWGTRPCDSATSICWSKIIWLQLKPSEPQRARSSPWLWIHYPSKISLLLSHRAVFVSVTTQRRGATYSC